MELKASELQNILENHKLWVYDRKKGKRAIMIGANLSGADLSEADLSGADLSEADLSGADLSEADLSGANLSEADLSGAVLRGADLSEADLSGANLSEADLSGADLSEADLRGANLREVNLFGADLRGADLRGAVLRGADLRGADLPIFCKWEYSIVENKIKIGCKIKTIEEWEEWLNSDEEYMTKRNENDFKRIEATIRACITYCKYLNN